jgi:polyketide biosynthesis malonyl-CoA-[acyl-carrier-protein] transacylase
MTVYVFPGQGTQKKGMGKGIFQEFTELLKQADDILGYSLEKLCLEDSEHLLNKTQFAQPAIYVVNALHYLKRIKEPSAKSDYIIGHSLGEYNALFAAGAFDFITGLKLVQQRALLMSQAGDGLMIAIIGLSYEQISAVLHEGQFSEVYIANYNTPDQFVLSGRRTNIEKLRNIFNQIDQVLCIPLKTSGPFHSPFMKECQEQFERYLERFEFYEPSVPVISNVTARPYCLEKLKKLLADQITHPVLWTESIKYLLSKGKFSFEELGNSTILSGLIKQIKKNSKQNKEIERLSLSASYYSNVFWLASQRLQLEEQCRYHIYGIFHYSEILDISRLKLALQCLVNTNYNLRTTFAIQNRKLQQFIINEQIANLACYWVSGEEQCNAVLEANIRKPFDLDIGPLFRFVLIIDSEKHTSTFLPIFHHIIIDGTQFDKLMTCISDYYHQSIDLQETDAVELMFLKEYLDVESELVKKADLKFWTEKLEDYPLQISLPKKHGVTDNAF